MLERYDRDAERYLRWWAPVLAPTASRLLDELEPFMEETGIVRILDVGAGTGNLTIGALERWPQTVVTAVDGSSGMLKRAETEVKSRLGGAGLERIEFVVSRAEELPFADGSFDLAVSSFVFQLLSDRPAAFREVWRVLKPGGRLGFVTWQFDDSPFAPDRVFDDALDEIDFEESDGPEETRSGDFTSPAAAAAQLRRTGFRNVRARTDWLEHRFDEPGFLGFLENYDEHVLFESLEPKRRARLRSVTEKGLAKLAPDEFLWRRKVVVAVAQRP